MLKQSKNRIKRAKPARHFKAWNDRDTTAAEKIRHNRSKDSNSKLRPVGEKNVSSSFAAGLRGGGSGVKPYGKAKKKNARKKTSKRHNTNRSNNIAEKRQAELAQKRMRKARSAALK